MRAPPCGRKPQSPTSRPKDRQKALIRQFQSYVRSQDLRHSAPREEIASIIVSLAGHFTANDMVSKIQSQSPSLGTATIYRTIPLLVDAGLLSRSRIDPDGGAVYEVEGGSHHDHIVCLDCGLIEEFHNDSIEREQSSIVQKAGFRAESHRHVIFGRCLKISGRI